MRILQLHVDWIEYEPLEKEIKVAEESEKKKFRYENVLLLLTAVESGDEKEMAEDVAKDVKEYADKLSCEEILIYPYSHLTNKLAKPRKALEVLKELEKEVEKIGLKCHRAPFGWNKILSFKIKGHPLSEHFSVFHHVEKTEEEEGKINEVFVILPSGKKLSREELDKKHEDIEDIIRIELKEKKESSFGTPPHVDLMRKLEIADYESISDVGNLRFYPNGALIIDLLFSLGFQMAKRLGALVVKTPYLIDPEHPSVKIMMKKFPERLYRVLPGKEEKAREFRLRPACDYGVWSIFKDATISYKQLPLTFYERDIIWRYEQSGELLGLHRLRNARMPDVHEMCKDLQQAFERFKVHISDFAISVYKALELKPSAIVLNCKRDFYEEHEKYFKSLSSSLGIPMIVKLFEKMKTYKVAWIDVVALDNLGRPMEISTVQLDTVSAEWWDISFTDSNGKKRRPVIIHTGFGIERTIACLLEYAESMVKNGRLPSLPLWLSPEQVRLIPVSEKYLKMCEELAEYLKDRKIRVSVDDRNMTVPKKVYEAKMKWIPRIVVIGEKEKEGMLPVLIREKSTPKNDHIESMTIEELAENVRSLCKDYPFLPSYLPTKMSKRPIFVPWGSS